MQREAQRQLRRVGEALSFGLICRGEEGPMQSNQQNTGVPMKKETDNIEFRLLSESQLMRDSEDELQK